MLKKRKALARLLKLGIWCVIFLDYEVNLSQGGGQPKQGFLTLKYKVKYPKYHKRKIANLAQTRTPLTESMQRLDEVLTQLEKAQATKPVAQGDASSAMLTKLQAENATLKKRHDAINTKLTKLISSLEQQLEG